MPPKLRLWLPVAALMLITLLLGTDLFAHRRTHEMLWAVLNWLGLDGLRLPRPLVRTGEGWLRKSAHFLEYGLLAALWFRALRGSSPERWRWSWAGLALVGAVAWAAVDELQQASIATERTGSVQDVVLDGCGAATALAVVGLFAWYRRRSASGD
ncbi:MAG TPA: VanZ family protein [Gemmatales bacterium]|nr:VanZ family protein [Gemmatales bacterium]HMP58343.1 VanZ family protein [Gemmatales bacterium]